MKSMIGAHAPNTATKDCTRLVDISRSEKRTCDAFSSEPAAVCESHRVGQLPCVHHDSPTWPCRQDHNYTCELWSTWPQALLDETICDASTAKDESSRCILDGLSRRTLRKVAKEDSLVAAARLAVRMNASDQLWLEFGAHSGTTARALGELHQLIAPDKPIYSFDSFRGLPETWRPQPPRGASKTKTRLYDAWNAFHSRGSFNMGGRPPFHIPTVEWVIGWFNESLPKFLHKPLHRHRNVSVVHIDCDLYSSTSTVLTLLAPRLSPNAILIFDELINYPSYAEHELKALRELQMMTGRSVRVLGTPAHSVLRDAAKIARMIEGRGGVEMPNVAPFQQDAAVVLL